MRQPRQALQWSQETRRGLSQPAVQVLKTMEGSLFCIVLPGDAQSTRRLSEVFMGGSIPVFIGPPYHSMPFSDFVDYRSSCWQAAVHSSCTMQAPAPGC